MAQVKIGPSFFKKEFSDYSNWKWAYVREALQNCMDAPGSNAIDVTTTSQDGNTIITFQNNGKPMTKEIVIDKLLALGESGKNFEGSTGGFGKAKVILYLCHKSYTIRTGTIEVQGIGGDYEIVEDLPYFHGTKSTVTIDGDQSQELSNELRRFARYAQWGGTLTLNSDQLECDLRKGSPRRDLGFGKVYTNKTFPNKIIVRIDGNPMFYESTGFDRCVIVELNGSSLDCLTANRDGLVYTYRSQLSSFITELSVDKKSALKDRKNSKYRHYDGRRFRHQIQKAINIRDMVTSVKESAPINESAPVNESVPANVPFQHGNGGVDLGTDEYTATTVVEGGEPIAHFFNNHTEQSSPHADNIVYQEHKSVPLGSQINEEFVILNETDMLIPNYYLPECPEFSTYSKKLVKIWGRLMLEMHKLFERSNEFAIGFQFDESTEASFEKGEYGEVFYINPATVVTQTDSGSRSFKKRFKLTERGRLISLAAHEFVHSLGFDYHDENYASKFTDVFATVLECKQRFNWCFAS